MPRKVVFIGVLASACYSGPAEDPEQPGLEETAGESSGGAFETGGPLCVPGQLDCDCLEGACGNGLVCIEGLCELGPSIDLDGDGQSVVAGVTVVLPGDGEGSTFRWTQSSGPQADIELADEPTARAFIPPDAAPGDVLTFTFTVERNGVPISADYPVQILRPDIVNPLADYETPAELGTPTGFAWGDDGLWVASSDGAVTQLTGGAVGAVFEVTGRPFDLHAFGNALLLSNAETMALELLDTSTGEVAPFIAELTGGGELGPVKWVLPDGNGTLFVSTEDGRLLYHNDGDGDDGGPLLPVTLEFLDTVGGTATAMVTEGNVLYVGTEEGRIKQVVLTPEEDPETGQTIPTGTVEPYLDVGAAVTGLAIDPTGGMWIGSDAARTLYIVRRPTSGQPRVVRELSPNTALAGLTNLHFRDSTLTWVNPDSGRMAQLETGI